jgi:hypothetical protein
MKEGAWLNAHTGAWCWITEHASWIHVLAHARKVDLPDEIHARLAGIPADFDGPGRRAILRVAMDAGLIRFRGHGADVTFEGTLPVDDLLRATAPFMAEHLGPATFCRVNDLATGTGREGYWRDLEPSMERPG